MRNSEPAYLVTYYDVRRLVTISIINAVAIPGHSNTIRKKKLIQSSFNI